MFIRANIQHIIMDHPHPQIHVPPELPEILKQFTKAAIKLQPKDVLAWGAAYFRALADGEPEPSGDASRKAELTPGLLRILNKQLGPKVNVPMDVIKEKWKDLSLPIGRLNCIIKIGQFEGSVEWIKFFALACSSMSVDIMESMKNACLVLSADPNGKIPFDMFMDIYRYLAKVDGTIPCEKVERVKNHLEQNDVQHGFITPKAFLKSDVMTGY